MYHIGIYMCLILCNFCGIYKTIFVYYVCNQHIAYMDMYVQYLVREVIVNYFPYRCINAYYI